MIILCYGFYVVGFKFSKVVISKTPNNNVIKEDDDVKKQFYTRDLYVEGYESNADNAICTGDRNVLVTIIVISAVDHFEERLAIRSGWGSVALKSPRVSFLFLVGLNEDDDEVETLRTKLATQNSFRSSIQ